MVPANYEVGMAQRPEEPSVLMQRIRAGDQEAARELVRVYAPHILRVVRRRLDQRLRVLFDSQDLEQDVWASFFADPPDDETLDNAEALVAHLIRAAHMKVIDTYRRLAQTQKREVIHERSLDGSAADARETLYTPEPTPSRVLAAQDELDRLVHGQPDHYRRILRLLAQGHSCASAAEEVGVSEKLVRRLLEKLAQGPTP
jgi:RNA polymerase sigma-70 factor (ECF subfamily)